MFKQHRLFNTLQLPEWKVLVWQLCRGLPNNVEIVRKAFYLDRNGIVNCIVATIFEIQQSLCYSSQYYYKVIKKEGKKTDIVLNSLD